MSITLHNFQPNSNLRIEQINKSQMRDDLPTLMIGDKVELKIYRSFEGKQTVTFKGIVIGKRNEKRVSYSFTLLKEVNKLVITSVFFYHLSPIISIKKINLQPDNSVKRAKLNYLIRKLTKKKKEE